MVVLETKLKFKLSKFNMFGIEWCLPIIALAMDDLSALALIGMFIGAPLAVIIAFIVNTLRRQAYVKALRVLRILSIIFALGSFIYIFMHLLRSPNEVFAKTILDPVPASVKFIKHGGSLSAMGSSTLYFAFVATSIDLENIISKRFSKFVKFDVKNISGRKPDLYQKVVVEAQSFFPDAVEIYIFEHQNSVYRFDALVVDSTFTKAYYRAY